MKCEELRERFNADPRCQEPEALQHIEGCTECAEWLAELQSFEMQLSNAMQVEIPEGLEARILKQRHAPREDKITPLRRIMPHRKWHPALAMAASLLLVIGLVTSVDKGPDSNLQEQQMLAWLSDQQPGQYLERQAPDAEVEKMFREVGAELVADVGTIHYCQVTQVNQRKVGYFVISGEQGPVSVMLVADGTRNIFTQSPAGADNSLTEQRIRESIRWI